MVNSVGCLCEVDVAADCVDGWKGVLFMQHFSLLSREALSTCGYVCIALCRLVVMNAVFLPVPPHDNDMLCIVHLAHDTPVTQISK